MERLCQVEFALEKAVRKGWFSREQEEEARDRISQTRLQLSSRSTSQEVRRRRRSGAATRKEIKERIVFTD